MMILSLMSPLTLCYGSDTPTQADETKLNKLKALIYKGSLRILNTSILLANEVTDLHCR